MKCFKCTYGHGNSYNYCFCLLFGLIVYQYKNIECSAFKPLKSEKNGTTDL